MKDYLTMSMPLAHWNKIELQLSTLGEHAVLSHAIILSLGKGRTNCMRGGCIFNRNIIPLEIRPLPPLRSRLSSSPMGVFLETTIYMWQSRVEIEGYSVTYFNCFAAFKVLYR